MKWTMAVPALMTILLILSASTNGSGTDWIEGMEQDVFGHTFAESSWYTTVETPTDDNGTAEFGVSFLNLGEIQAFLVTLNGVEDSEGNVGVLPYQMFGMHYFTSEGKEVFIGALLAFLNVFEDKDNNSVPGPGERSFYVIPFGAGKIVNGTYPPTVTNIGVEKVDDSHYRMGITYRNMYAVASENPLLSAYLATGWVLQFSELTVTYEIELDRETGTLSAETFYTIGQISTLYAVVLGIPFKSQDIQETIPDNFGIGAVHFTNVFTSNYKVVDHSTGTTLDTGREKVMNGTIDISVGDTRAFSVGLRGDFDLIDEGNDTVLRDDQNAYNMILKAKLNDLVLVGWQLGFSAKVFAAMAFGLSHQVRNNYGSAEDLRTESTRPGNPGGFGSQAFWYGVFFPRWEGYRVVHDPEYTAYFGSVPDIITDVAEDVPGPSIGMVALSGFLACAILAVINVRRQRDN